MLVINFHPFPNLKTERLQLRPIENSDVKEVFALRSNPSTMKFIPRPLLKNDEEALEHIAVINSKIDNHLKSE